MSLGIRPGLGGGVLAISQARLRRSKDLDRGSQGSDFTLQPYRLALSVARGKPALAESDRSFERPQPEEAPEVGKEAHAAPPANVPHRVPGRIGPVAEGDGRHVTTCFERGLQQGAAERQHLRSVRARSLGKKDDRHPAPQGIFDVLHLPRNFTAMCTTYENRAGQPGGPTDKRPGAHLGFGHEAARTGRTECGDIEVGKMVADDQSAARGHADDAQSAAHNGERATQHPLQPSHAGRSAAFCAAHPEQQINGQRDRKKGGDGRETENFPEQACHDQGAGT